MFGRFFDISVIYIIFICLIFALKSYYIIVIFFTLFNRQIEITVFQIKV